MREKNKETGKETDQNKINTAFHRMSTLQILLLYLQWDVH